MTSVAESPMRSLDSLGLERANVPSPEPSAAHVDVDDAAPAERSLIQKRRPPPAENEKSPPIDSPYGGRERADRNGHDRDLPGRADADSESSGTTFGSLEYCYGGVVDCGDEPMFGDAWSVPFQAWGSPLLACSPLNSEHSNGESAQKTQNGPRKNACDDSGGKMSPAQTAESWSETRVPATARPTPFLAASPDAFGAVLKSARGQTGVSYCMPETSRTHRLAYYQQQQRLHQQHDGHNADDGRARATAARPAHPSRSLACEHGHCWSSDAVCSSSHSSSSISALVIVGEENMTDLSGVEDIATICSSSPAIALSTTAAAAAASARAKTIQSAPTVYGLPETSPYQERRAFSCESCRLRIMDRSMFHDGDSKYWHTDCLQCCRCGTTMSSGDKYTSVNGRVYCERDYNLNCPKPNQTRCHKCHGVLAGREAVQEARYENQWVYMHERCFVCDVCNKPLQSGTRYMFYQQWMVCESHFEQNGDSHFMHDDIMKLLDTWTSGIAHPNVLPSYQPTLDFPLESPTTAPAHISRYASPTDQFDPLADLRVHPPHYHPYAVHPQSRLPPTSPTDMLTFNPYHPHEYWRGTMNTGMSMMPLSGKAIPSKQRRSRTSFSEEQHRILLERFEEDPTPDSSDLEKIGIECELPKRTVQIWFQNARARSKKVRTDTSSQSSQSGSKPEQQQQEQQTGDGGSTSEAKAFAMTTVAVSATSPASTPSATESLTSPLSANTQTALTPRHRGAPHTLPAANALAEASGGAAAEDMSPGTAAAAGRYKPDSAGTPLSVDQSPLSLGGQPLSHGAADWLPGPGIMATGFEHIDLFHSPPFVAQDSDILPFGLLGDSKSPEGGDRQLP